MPDTERERLLAQFERKTGEAKAAIADAPAAEEYVAFNVKDRTRVSLNVRSLKHAWEFIIYNYLLRVVVDHPECTKVAIIYTHMTVVLQGKNLLAVSDAIADKHCEFIQQFDPTHWQKPTNPEAAIIETIEYITDSPPAKVAAEMELA